MLSFRQLFRFWIVFMLFGLPQTTVMAGGSYDVGLVAYQQQQYTKALPLLEKAVKEDPKNATKVFYLGLTHARMKQYDQAKVQFETVLRLVPPSDPLAAKARKNISVMTKRAMILNGNRQKAQNISITMQDQGDDYLAHTITDGKVVHWDPSQMPLKVYISSGKSVPAWNISKNDVVRTAMRTWTAATYNKVRFITTSNPQEADIIVRWQSHFAHNKVGENPFEARGNTIVRSDISLATLSGTTNQPLSMKNLQTTAIHEMGMPWAYKGTAHTLKT